MIIAVIPPLPGVHLFKFPDGFQWLPPWILLPGDYSTLIPISWPHDQQLAIGRDAIVEELRREMPESHVLHNMKLNAIAVHVEYGYKDFVFATDNGKHPIATAHLTYTAESDPNWPSTTQFLNLDEWIRQMNLDHQNAGMPDLDCSLGHYRMISRQIDNETQWFCARCGQRDALPNRDAGG